MRLPGVRFGCRAARPPGELVDLLEHCGLELDLERLERSGELLFRARADDGRRDDLVVEEPSDAHVGGLVAELAAETLEPRETRADLFAFFLLPITVATALFGAAFATAHRKQAASERAPGDDSHAVALACRNDLELDGATEQVVLALF